MQIPGFPVWGHHKYIRWAIQKDEHGIAHFASGQSMTQAEKHASIMSYTAFFNLIQGFFHNHCPFGEERATLKILMI